MMCLEKRIFSYEEIYHDRSDEIDLYLWAGGLGGPR